MVSRVMFSLPLDHKLYTEVMPPSPVYLALFLTEELHGVCFRRLHKDVAETQGSPRLKQRPGQPESIVILPRSRKGGSRAGREEIDSSTETHG